jgi:hypothetical protein
VVPLRLAAGTPEVVAGVPDGAAAPARAWPA